MAEVEKSKILLVDDEINILEAFKRQLRNEFLIELADGPEMALRKLQNNGASFAVIVADLQMPKMNGLDLLKEFRKRSPDIVRVMLTGNNDQRIAVQAVNESAIFRFLNKPCSSEDLGRVLQDAVTHHKLITAERDLLQNTLVGSIKLLTDILSMIDPKSFGESMKMRDRAKLIAGELNISAISDIELGSMLTNIGSIAIPMEVSVKVQAGQKLSPQETEIIERVPEVGKTLLSNISRLGHVSEIVYYQNKGYDGSGFPSGGAVGEKIPQGARIIKVLKDLGDLESDGLSARDAIVKLKTNLRVYDPKIIEVVSKLFGNQVEASPNETERVSLSVNELLAGQIVLTDVETTSGMLLLKAGTALTQSMIMRLRSHALLAGVKQPILVNCKTDKTRQSVIN